ncbi:hypothetical protein [uncultured Amaricoccus sp.]|uniref:DsbA family protein n=1 Tax=uncultured Amaricoccus sp. TaxID=339341 RepID=UPI00261F8061|nr:hypothetical protein [uncultured Amaricoccus sp.]HRO13215.1 hypothetical protein [Amaricoccus sp.]
MTGNWQADPLSWGRGQRRFEVFLEPTCPYSARAFGKLWDFLALVGEERVTLHVRLLSQPWHLFSGVVTRGILAASTTPGGKEAARAVMRAVYDHREEFEFEDHCCGPNLDATPNQIIERMEDYSGLPFAEAFALPGLERATILHCKYARQNGIHVSPTFMIDGIVAPGLGSGDSIEDWAAKL